VLLSADRKFRVNSECESIANGNLQRWFVLPPVQAHYYKAHSLSYKPLPPLREDCAGSSSGNVMQFIYPKEGTRILIPKKIDGNFSSTIFQLAHANPDVMVHWHLDGIFLGSTEKTHQMALNPRSGLHKVTAVDENGETLEQIFEVLSAL
jgi:penicillin-binding protein 1C